MTSLLLSHTEYPEMSTRPRVAATADRAGDLLAVESRPIDLTDLLTVARGLVRSARRWPGMSQPVRRRWDLMMASETFEAWVIGWPPGGAIELHDHGCSSGAVVVASGELVETVVADRGRGLIATETAVIPTLGSVTFGTSHVHDIVNMGTTPAISVHVYAPRLTSMTYYEIKAGHLEAGRTIRYHLEAAI